MPDLQPLPDYLREDAPVLRCSVCGRSSISFARGAPCDMPQPNGSICPGVFGGPPIATTERGKTETRTETYHVQHLAPPFGWVDTAGKPSTEKAARSAKALLEERHRGVPFRLIRRTVTVEEEVVDG